MGVSIGVSRLLGACFHSGALEPKRRTPAKVLVLLHSEAEAPGAHEVARALRKRGIACLVSHRAAAYGKQMQWAEKVGIQYVWFPAKDGKEHEVKDLGSGSQAPASVDSWTPPTP